MSELSAAIKRTLEGAYGYVPLRGEISGFRGAAFLGPLLLRVKDDKAQIEAVIRRTHRAGPEVQAGRGPGGDRHRADHVYPGKSIYQSSSTRWSRPASER